MDELQVFERLGLALGLGLLVGLQRESVRSPLAGIRTFALITLLGAICGLLSSSLGGWVVALGVFALAALLCVGSLVQFDAKETSPGLTTEIAALLMFGVGAYLVVGHPNPAIALAGVVAVLLQFKRPMHAFVARIGEADLRAIMQFVLVALVILPVLPDRAFGPYGVLNLHNIWLMVVLIVGLSLCGYVAYKLFGQKAGAVLAGVLGGAISSTATTLVHARRPHDGKDELETARLAALVLVAATAMSFARVLAELAVTAPGVFGRLAGPLFVMLLLTVLLSAGLFLLGRGDHGAPTVQGNPAELKLALFFGVFYALALLGIAAAQDAFGATGLYTVAILSGLHDLDAITLSTARLVDLSQVTPEVGWRLILTASMSNLVMKAGIVGLLGNTPLLRRLAVPFGVAILGGLLLLLLWPDTQ